MTKLIGVLDRVGDDVLAGEQEIVAAMQDLMSIPGLDTITATPTWVDVDESRPSTGWLYYDCQYRLVRGHLPAGFIQRPHDHGAWNIIGVYRGAMHYRSYRRVDDGERPYHAELEVAEDRVLSEGEVAVLPGPPHDIHSTAGLAPHTVSFLIARQEFNPMRRQYIPELSSYYVVDADTAAK